MTMRKMVAASRSPSTKIMAHIVFGLNGPLSQSSSAVNGRFTRPVRGFSTSTHAMANMLAGIALLMTMDTKPKLRSGVFVRSMSHANPTPMMRPTMIEPTENQNVLMSSSYVSGFRKVST